IGVLRSALLLPDLSMSETTNEVVVHHAGGLHVRVNDRRADEAESSVLEVLAERIGLRRSCRNLSHRLPTIELWLTVDEAPTIRIEASKLLLDGQKRAGVAYRGFDLLPIADDLWVGYKFLDIPLGVARNFCRIEFVECAAIALSFFQHERPVQSRLRT